jgi:hypothetical protein
MTHPAEDFSGFGALSDGDTVADCTEATATMLRTALAAIDLEGRMPTNRESLDVLSAIASIRSGDTHAARMFARRVQAFSERRAAPRVDERRLYSTAQLRVALHAALTTNE